MNDHPNAASAVGYDMRIVVLLVLLPACLSTRLPEAASTSGGSSAGSESSAGSGSSSGLGSSAGQGSSSGSSGGTGVSDFSMALADSSLSLLPGDTATTTVSLTRQGGFAEAVAVTLSALPSGISADPLSIAGAASSGTLTLHAAASATPGSLSVTVSATAVGATAPSQTHTAPLTVISKGLIPVVDSVRLSSNGPSDSHQIRQGYGSNASEILSVTVDGSRLSGIALPAIAIDGTGFTLTSVVSDTDTELVFTAILAHGAPPGAHALTMTNAIGVSDPFADAMDVTTIHAAPSGSDSSPGTAQQPFHTVASALLVAAAGDTVSLGAGTYSAANSESFPLAIPDGVTLLGVGASATTGSIIQGQGGDEGMTLTGAVRLDSLLVTGFKTAVSLSSGAPVLTLNQVLFSGNGEGVDIANVGASIIATDATSKIATQSGFGVIVVGTGTVMLSGGTYEAASGAVSIELLGTSSANIAAAPVTVVVLPGSTTYGFVDNRAASSGTLKLTSLVFNNGTTGDTFFHGQPAYSGPTNSQAFESGAPRYWQIVNTGNGLLF